MSYLQLAYLHLASVLPAFLIGTFLLLRRKGSPLHKLLGKIFMVLMLITATITLFMPAQLGPTLLGHFGFIHIFSLLVFNAVPRAYLAVRKGDIISHRNNLIGLYVGAIIIAGGFALLPGRLIYQTLFG